jgi:large subunit ribosomal protein L14
MIQKGTYLNVIDNSGAKEVCCIHVLNGYRKRYAVIGDVIVVSIKSLRLKRRSHAKINKGEVLKALVVRTRVCTRTYSLEQTCYLENAVILLSTQYKLLGTRIFGVVPNSFRYTKFLRIISLSSGFTK